MRFPWPLTVLVACAGRGCRGCGPDDTGHTGDPCQEEAQETWYADADDDGHGNPNKTEVACEAPEGSVAVGDDCDDSDGSVWQETEVYLDADGDGFGTGQPSLSCGVQEGLSAQDGDCDDADVAVNPDAEAVCGDALDNDCDGEPDCANPREATQEELLAARIAGEGSSALGASVLMPGDLDGDGVSELAVGATSLDGAGGAALFSSPVQGELNLADASSVAVGAYAGILAGASLTFGQVDEDDEWDWIIGAPGFASGVGTNAFVVHGPFEAEVSLEANDSVTTLRGVAAWSLVSGLDYRGDATHDLFYGNETAIVLLNGPIDVGEVYPEDLLGGLLGAEEAESGLRVSAVGDVTGDGSVDILIGAPEDSSCDCEAGDADDERLGAGNLYLIDDSAQFFAGRDGELDAHEVARVRVIGESTGSRLGAAVGAAGDVDGDGYADILGGAPGWTRFTADEDVGAAYLLSGAVLSEQEQGALLTAEEGVARVYGEEDGDGVGTSVAGADLDGDGRSEVIVGAPGLEDGRGQVLVWFGAVTGEKGVEDAELALTGEAAGDQLGAALDAGGDVNGLGWADLVVGAPGVEGGDGAVYVFTLDRW